MTKEENVLCRKKKTEAVREDLLKSQNNFNARNLQKPKKVIQRKKRGKGSQACRQLCEKTPFIESPLDGQKKKKTKKKKNNKQKRAELKAGTKKKKERKKSSTKRQFYENKIKKNKKSN